MKPFSEYFKVPEGFNLEYVSNVMKAIYPIIFLVSLVMVALSIFIMGVAYFEMIKSGSIIKHHVIESIEPKTKLKIGAILFLTAVFYSRWYIVVFFPDGILKMVL